GLARQHPRLLLIDGGGAACCWSRTRVTSQEDGIMATSFKLVSKIAITSTRDNPTGNPQLTSEIYLIDPDGGNPQRLTTNTFGDAFPTLSPDGKKVVFDSNRLNADSGQPLNVGDLFVMDADGTNQVLLTRGSSATWSPESNFIAFHASASYYASGGTVTGTPTRTDPGAAMTDSDLFVANVHALAAVHNVLTKTQLATNITNTPDQIEDDPDWAASPTTAPGGQSIVFTSHPVTDDPLFSNQAEIYVINPDGTGRLRLTDNDYEERAPAWSPDGTRIVFCGRVDGGRTDFEICVMNADGSGFQQLTNNSVNDLTPSWSPDGTQIAFHRLVSGQGQQMFIMNATNNPDGTHPVATQVTSGPGINLIAHWGQVRTHVKSDPGDTLALGDGEGLVG